MQKKCVTNGVVIVLLFWFLVSGAPEAAAEIKLGILPRLHAIELFTMFNPLAEYLTRETGEKVSIVIPKDFDAFKSAVKAGQLDAGFANSLIYVQLRRNVAIEPLAVASELKAGTRFRGIIITRADSGIKTLQDLRGRKLVFVERDSAGGYVFQMLLLKKAGFDIRKDFTLLPFAKKHDNVTKSVFNKVADAGGIREDDLEKMKGEVDLSKIKIVGYTDYFPNWPLFVSPALNRERAGKIQAALLKLKPNTSLSRAILGASMLAGFAPVSDREYDDLRLAVDLVGAW
jgi:phosphonate transport system substrate-binding protein